MINRPALVSETENVVRILHRDWVVNGILQHYAFVLRRNEAYISVNRPVVPSFDADVASFVTHHPDYYADENKMGYRRAVLNVGAVRQTEVMINDIKLDIDVDVEPRDTFAKSHAGIFTRYEGRNIKTGDFLSINPLEEVSSDDILLEVRSRLLDLAQLEYCKINPTIQL